MRLRLSITALVLGLYACASAPVDHRPPETRHTEAILPVNGSTLVRVPGAVAAHRHDLTGHHLESYDDLPATLERPGDGEFRVHARTSAAFTLSFFDKAGDEVERMRVTVATRELLGRFREIERLLGKVDGLTVSLRDSRVVLDGALANSDTLVRDMDRILWVQEAFRDIVLNLVSISPEVYEASRKRMEMDIRAALGHDGVKLRWVQGTYLIEGEVASTAERELAEAITQTHLPPMMGSVALRDNLLVLGAKKFSIRNFLKVRDRAPASAP